jgi:hypothetical protein
MVFSPMQKGLAHHAGPWLIPSGEERKTVLGGVHQLVFRNSRH